VIFREQTHGGHASEPIQQFVLQIADRHKLGLHGKFIEHEPASKGARRLAAHQPAAYDPNPHFVHD
jgi:hypothetical protein